MSAQIEIVLPLKPHDAARGSDLARVRDALLPSFARWCDPGFIARFTIVVPGADLSAVAALADATRLPLAIVAEDTLIAPPPPMPRHGWYVQQMLKIAYAGRCRTPIYLTLDADILLAAPLDAGVIAGGRAPIQPEPLAAHPGWWPASAAALGAARDAAATPAAPVFGVTPGFLHSAVMRHVIRRLTVRAEAERLDWPGYLAAHTTATDDTWTEYGLYWTALINGWRPDALHTPRRLYAFAHAAAELEPLLAGPAPPLFGVLQSAYAAADDHIALARRLLAAVSTAP